MKLGKIIWPALVICCIGLGVWQRHNISVFWREYHSLWRDYDYSYNKHYPVPCRPIIPKNIARTDPEAAAVADMVLRYYEDEERLPALAESLLKFPDNEFFLFWCINEVFRFNELDQEVSVKLAEKLISLDNDNSLYHNIKVAALLADRQSDNITPALEEIKTAANCPNFYFPYTKYIQRVMALAQKVKLHQELVKILSSQSYWAPWVREIHKTLLRYAHRAFTDGEIEKGLLIDDAINSIGKNQLDAGYNEARVIMNRKNFFQPFGIGRWECPEALELQRADITEQRARQNRLRLCAYALQQIKSEGEKDREDSGLYREPDVTDELIITTLIAVHNGRILFATVIVWLAFIAICMIRGWSSNQRTGFGALLLFSTASLCYFFVIQGGFFIIFLEMCPCYYLLQYIMRPTPFGWEQPFDKVPAIYLFLLLICPILVALFLWATSRPKIRKMSFLWRMLLKLILSIIVSAIVTTLLGIFGHFAHKQLDLPKLLLVFDFVSIFTLTIALLASWLYKLRFVRVVLAAMPLGVLTVLASPYAYISQIPMILFVVICTLIVLKKPSEPMPFRRVLKGIFSKRPESAAIRIRAVKLLAIFLVIHWLLLVASVPVCARYIDQPYFTRPWSYPKSDLAPADEASYQRVLTKFDSNDFIFDELYKLIPLVTPKDLPYVLKKTKNRCFSSSYPFKLIKSPAECNDVNSQLAQNQLKKRLNDWDLIFAMQGCGRDVVNIIADFMDNPEREFALVSRAKLGDVRVKGKLEQMFASRLQSGEPPEPNERQQYWERPVKIVDIICALACISEPNEAGARFMDYVSRYNKSQSEEIDKFFRGIALLPTNQAREVIKAYLTKAQDWQPSQEIIWGTAREVVGTYADKEISEAVLKIMLRSEDSDIVKDWDGPGEAPRDFDAQSADLLKQGLTSKNDQIRAWCVWQLRKVGYQFSENEISRLLTDESWKVRANAVIAGGRKTAEQAAKDADPFVRWVASLTGSEEN
jgi:hypothetical protein